MTDRWQTVKQVKRHDLSRRQREVAQLLAESRTTKEIAIIIHVSEKTVQYHRNQIYRVFRLPTHWEFCNANLALLTRWAVKWGMVEV